MKIKSVLIALILMFNLLPFGNVHAETEGAKPTIESISVDKKEVTVGDTVKISVKIKEYDQYSSIVLYYSSPITDKGITIDLDFNNETKSFEGSFPISEHIESGNYIPDMMSLYNSGVTTIYNSEYDKFDAGTFHVDVTSSKELIESINISKKEVTVGDVIKVSLKTSTHSGIRYFNSSFRSPITNQTLTVSLRYNPDTNMFEGNIPISSIYESGTYKLFMLNTYEEEGNNTAFYSRNYAEIFQEADFSVNGTDETNIIESITLDKKELTIGETVEFTVKAPKLSGIRYLNLNYSSPVTDSSFPVNLYFNSETELFEGSYSTTNEFEIGKYTLTMMGIYDSSGNTSALYNDDYSEFEKGDFIFLKEENPPTFMHLWIDKDLVETGENVRINVSAHDDTKLLEGTIYYIAPQTKTKISLELTYDENTNQFFADFPIDDMSETGIWKVDSIELKDTNKNLTTIQAATSDLSNGEFTVKDITAPSTPIVNELTDKATAVIGKAEAGTKVIVKMGDKIIGTTISDKEGNYSVIISLQKAGIELTVTATDAAGNISEAKEIIIGDETAPALPTVNEVIDKLTSITGTGEIASTITVKAGTKEIGTATVTADGNYSVTIVKQQAGTILNVTATDEAGNTSEAKEVTVLDATVPTLPTVEQVTDKSTSVKGSAEAASFVIVKDGDTEIGKVTVNEAGRFELPIKKQKAGTILNVTATDAAGNVSAAKEVTVLDVTAPNSPTVDKVTDKSTAVTGTGELNSLVSIKAGSKELGTATVGADSKYKVTISAQKAGTEILITATDKAGNISEAKETTVLDGTAPAMPTVNEVTDKSTTVTGTGEADSQITIKSESVEIGAATVDAEGKYSITIAKQKAGTKLQITSTDNTGNVSAVKELIVIDVTVPSTPTVDEVTDKFTSVTGTGEKSSLITIKAETKEIGTATVNAEGNYSVPIAKQKAGTKLTVIATDAAGNISDSTDITVIDNTVPEIPSVKEVTDRSSSIAGAAEAGSVITVKAENTMLGTGTADADGNYSILIPKQKAGTKLLVTATDSAGNISEAKELTVQSKIYQGLNISRLGHLDSVNVRIYEDFETPSEYTLAGKEYTDEVYYIKKQSTFENAVYYLISRNPSSTSGVIGWVKASDMSTHTHKGVDRKAKTFYLNGKGSAFSKAWGGNENSVQPNLALLKGQKFQVNLTEKVGNNIWYRGVIDGKTVWIHEAFVSSDSLVSESSISRLGHLDSSSVRIYSDYVNQAKYVEAGTENTDEVYYIKKQASVGDDLYYLISRNPSSTSGVVGWVKASDMSTHTHKGADRKAKTFYLNGKGSAFSKAWGGSENSVHPNLSLLKGQVFQVNLTEKVGNNIWYHGVIDGKTAWVHEAFVSSESLVSESSTSRLGHLDSSSVRIYSDYVNQAAYSKAGTENTEEVYYIKKQASVENDLYYLISRNPSSMSGVVGWVKASDMSTHTHKGADRKAKTFYLNGKGSAFEKAWGGQNNLVFDGLTDLKGNVFAVNLTEKVGGNTWYRGVIEGKTAWIHEAYLSSEPFVSKN